MGRRTNTAKWLENQKRWQVNVQKDGKRRSFYSSTPGRTGQREANAKADAWLDEGIHSRGERVSDLYEIFKSESKATVGTSAYAHIVQFGKNWILPVIGAKKALSLHDGDIQKILDWAAAEGKSKKTIQDINGTITKFLKWAGEINTLPTARTTYTSRLLPGSRERKSCSPRTLPFFFPWTPR